MKNEDAVWDMLRVLMTPLGHMNRIESHATSIGFPDVDYCFSGVPGQIELKHVLNLGCKPKMRPSQWGWFRQRVRAEGRPFVLIGTVEEGAYLVEGRHLLETLVPDSHAHEWFAVACHHWYFPPTPNELLEILTHGEEIR